MLNDKLVNGEGYIRSNNLINGMGHEISNKLVNGMKYEKMMSLNDCSLESWEVVVHA